MRENRKTSPTNQIKAQGATGSPKGSRRLKWFALAMAVLMWSTLAAAWIFPSDPAQPMVDPVPTSTSRKQATSSISGIVWHDLCESSIDEEALRQGCVWESSREMFLANGTLEAGEPGIQGVEISLGIGQCPSMGLATVSTGVDGGYSFSGLEAGEYCVWVNSSVLQKLAKVVPGVWTFPKVDDGDGNGWTTINLGTGEDKGGVNFGWDYLNKPVVEINEHEAETEPTPICTDRATFVQDVTIADGTYLAPEKIFEKVWRLKNTGTCTWTQDYSLVFDGGDALGAQATSPFLKEVPPEGTVDLAMVMQAPKAQGSYKGYWMLRSPNETRFGIGKDADRPFWVEIAVDLKPDRNYVESWSYSLDPSELADEGRWIDVDVSQQRLTTYDGSTPVKSFVVSTGTTAHPTVLGQFRIWIKLEFTDMSGPGYHLEDVPYTMYFYQGYGLHGAYWHNNFGTPMSHGCVNLEISDAAWLFDFASVGTLVNVHP
jgi:hypothetical protein